MDGALTIRHCAVMIQEVCTLLTCKTPGTYVDCTLGGGAHTRALLDASPPTSTVIGIDRDPQCITAARQWGQAWGQRFIPLHGNFRDLHTLLAQHHVQQVDGILFDLGVSSYQLDTAARGFSFRHDGPLDMRMDTTQGDGATTLVNTAPPEHLESIFRTLGEERWARRIAHAIAHVRQHTPITQTRHLADIVSGAIPRAAWPAHIHPATRVFQALRMAVNEELPALQEALPQAVAALRPGGRLGVLTFHSLEDHHVKHFFRQEAYGCVCPPRLAQCLCRQQPRVRLVTRKPLVPTPEAVRANPRSRSAHLRGVEKLAEQE